MQYLIHKESLVKYALRTQSEEYLVWDRDYEANVNFHGCTYCLDKATLSNLDDAREAAKLLIKDEIPVQIRKIKIIDIGEQE